MINHLKLLNKLKYIILSVIILNIMSCTTENELPTKEELTIYDKNGNAVAYCNFSHENETIIYLWNGKPTAYYSSENENLLYGFNGKFLGWRDSGIYYDLNGKRIGFEKGSSNIVTSADPLKHIKEILPVKGIKEMQHTRPINSIDWSTEALDSFLLKGRE